MQTTFFFDPSEHKDMTISHLNSEHGGYEPSQEDAQFAPFYPDSSQRVLVVEPMGCVGFYAVKTEALLRLAQERKGEDLQWGEWKAHSTWVFCDLEATSFWVSGPLLFCVAPTQFLQIAMEVYDFSAQAYARCMKMIKDGTAKQFEPSITHTLPWRVDEVAGSYGSHNSITFFLVKSPYLPNPTWD